MRILVIPDIHLGKGTNWGKDPIGVGLNSRIEDQVKLLDTIYKFIIDNNVKYVFMLGDIWDDVNPKSSVTKVFFEWISKIYSQNVEIYIIVGNHDFVRSGHDRVSMLDSLEAMDLSGIHIIRNPSVINMENCSITMLPFTDRRQLNKDKNIDAINYFKTFLPPVVNNKINILLGHMAIEGSIWVGDEVDEESNELFLPISMLSKYDYVWMGHVHNMQVLNNENPYVAHLGSLDKTAFSGPGNSDKFFLSIDTNPFSFKYIKLLCRNLISFDIDVPVDEKDSTKFVISQINKDLSDAIVKINVKLFSHDAIPIDRDEVNSFVMNKKAFHVLTIKESRSVDKVIIKNAEVDETIDHIKAVDIFTHTMDVDNEYKKSFSDFCKLIINKIKGK